MYKDSTVVLALGVGYYHYICTQGFLRTSELRRSMQCHASYITEKFRGTEEIDNICYTSKFNIRYSIFANH